MATSLEGKQFKPDKERARLRQAISAQNMVHESHPHDQTRLQGKSFHLKTLRVHYIVDFHNKIDIIKIIFKNPMIIKHKKFYNHNTQSRKKKKKKKKTPLPIPSMR